MKIFRILIMQYVKEKAPVFLHQTSTKNVDIRFNRAVAIISIPDR